MNLTLSPQLRLIALIGAAVMVVALGGMFFVVRGTLLSGEIEQLPPTVHKPKAKAESAQAIPAKKAKPEPKTAATPKAETRAKPKAEPAATPKAETPKTAAPKATTPKAPGTIQTPGVAPNGLPMMIAQALRKQPVVVVALVVPGAELDELTIAEAKAGAKTAGVGFVSINILKNSIGRPLAQKLGVIQTPSLVVYRRPATVFVRFEGFADRDTVRQAATSARTAR